MKMVIKAVGILLFIIAMTYGSITQNQYSWIYSLLLVITLIITILTEMVENIRAVFWGCVVFLGMLWSGKQMIMSIDFDKPILTSFYWSTLGYLFLTVFFMLLTISIFNQASKDYSFDKD